MELKDYLHVIRVRKWIIIAAVLVVTATAVLVSLRTPKVYQGDASILVTEKDTGAALAGAVLNELSAQPERGLQTQVQLMQLRPLAERVIRKLNLRTKPDELMKRVTVSPVGQTNLITLSVTDSNPQRAAATANAFATSYVEWSRDIKRANITSALTEVENRLTEARIEILDLGDRMNGGDSSRLQDQLKTALSEQQTLTDRLVQLTAEEQAPEVSDAARSRARSEISSTRRQLDEVKTRIVDLGSRLASSGDASNNKELLAQLQIATGLYTTLAEKYETLKVTEQLEIGSGSVVAEAAVNPDPVSPKPLRNGVLALAVGLVFGLGMAFLAEYLDNTIKSTDEAEKLFGAPVLGNIPTEDFEKGDARRLTIVQYPGSRAAEAYRGLRNSIDYVNFEHDVKTLLVTSAAPSEGKSTVSANLAASLAMAGAKVVLINCDFRRPTTDQFFDVDNQLGLSDLLAGRVSLEGALQSTGDKNLVVLTPGKMPPNPSELLGSQKMTDLIESLKANYDWVIVDSPPLLAVADAAATTRWTDGVLVVTRAGISTHPAATNARDILDKVGARILGVVVWGLEESAAGRSRYGGYYGGYYSDYYGGRQADSGARSTFGAAADESDSGTLAARVEPQRSGTSAWTNGWRLGVLVFAGVAVALIIIVVVLDAQLGIIAL